MADDDYLPEHERRMLRRHRRPTVRAAVAVQPPPKPRSDATEPRLELDSERPERSTGRVQSFRARALVEYSERHDLALDLRKLLEQVLSGRRDAQLATAVGTDPKGLRDLERRFQERVGRSVYVAAVEVVNRSARLRSEALG